MNDKTVSSETEKYIIGLQVENNSLKEQNKTLQAKVDGFKRDAPVLLDFEERKDRIVRLLAELEESTRKLRKSWLE